MSTNEKTGEKTGRQKVGKQKTGTGKTFPRKSAPSRPRYTPHRSKKTAGDSTVPAGSYFTREQLGLALGDNAQYIPLVENSKVALGSWSSASRRLNEIPVKGNYGIIPRNRLVVLDFDHHLEASASEKSKSERIQTQVRLFSALLGTDLSKTLNVRTLSGGLHCYLFAPEGVVEGASIPLTSLRSHARAILSVASNAGWSGEEEAAFVSSLSESDIDADVRSGAANSYVVGFGSVAETKNHVSGSYQITNAPDADNAENGGFPTIAQLSVEGFNQLKLVRSLTESQKAESSASRASARLDKNTAAGTNNAAVTSYAKLSETDELSEGANSALNGGSEVAGVPNNGKAEAAKSRTEAAKRHQDHRALMRAGVKSSLPLPRHLRALRNSLDRYVERTGRRAFHARRAYVNAVLQCCFDDEAILRTWRTLELDHDTYRSGYIMSDRELERDLARLNPGPARHSHVCDFGTRHESQERQQSITPLSDDADEDKPSQDETIPAGFVMLADGTLAPRNGHEAFRNYSPRVIDLAAVFKQLTAPKKARSLASNDAEKKPRKRNVWGRQYMDAMAIIDYSIQPLANSGATMFVMSSEHITSKLGLTMSQFKQAMRLLRERDILCLYKAPYPGRAAVYELNEMFVHRQLTRVLKMTWIAQTENHEPLFFDRSVGQFVKTISMEVMESPISILEEVTEMESALPNQYLETLGFGPGAASSYFAKGYRKVVNIEADVRRVEHVSRTASASNVGAVGVGVVGIDEQVPCEQDLLNERAELRRARVEAVKALEIQRREAAMERRAARDKARLRKFEEECGLGYFSAQSDEAALAERMREQDESRNREFYHTLYLNMIEEDSVDNSAMGEDSVSTIVADDVLGSNEDSALSSDASDVSASGVIPGGIIPGDTNSGEVSPVVGDSFIGDSAVGDSVTASDANDSSTVVDETPRQVDMRVEKSDGYEQLTDADSEPSWWKDFIKSSSSEDQLDSDQKTTSEDDFWDDDFWDDDDDDDDDPYYLGLVGDFEPPF